MSELVGFPMKSQLRTTLSDGSIDKNASYDCVGESIAASMEYLTGQHFEGGVLKEAVYGRDYQGGTDIARYVEYVAAHGVLLSPVECGTYAHAVLRAHEYVANGYPVIFTQQDDYAPLQFRNEWTHVCVFYKDAPGSLTCMDPFIAAPLTHTDAEWTARLRSTELWILEKQQVAPKEVTPVMQPISLSTPRVSDFYEQAGSMWRCKFAYNPSTKKMEPSDKGALVGNAILQYYQVLGGVGLNGLTDAGLPLTPETGIAQNITAQVFERCIIMYDPSHKVDNPPGSGEVYKLNLCNKIAQSILQHVFNVTDASNIAPLQEQITSLTQENKHLSDDNALLMAHVKELSTQTPSTQLQAQLAQALSRLQEIEQEIDKIKELATI